jgi:D-serine deaminase-like pyridoxal phosphate-dependent protein
MISSKRRKFMLAAGIGAAGLIALKPSAKGAPHNSYFTEVSQALRQAGIATPTLVIDRQQLQKNVGQIVSNINGRVGLRLVVKSLPCLSLIQEITRITHSQHMMLFSLPQLLTMAKGEVDILLGKPMPVAAAASFYQRLPSASFAPDRQLQWLIDTPERLIQYRDLARGQALNLRVNFEIDVGLHRGGIPDAQTLQQMLEILKSEPRLQFSGMMGYDAHVAKIPDLPGLQKQAHEHAHTLYDSYARQALASLKPDGDTRFTFNAAGSPTYRLYDGSGVENEVSVGSAMVKASDFDLPGLADLQPAVFIATPVLKVLDKFQMPYGVEFLGAAARAWDPNQQRGVFIYGGNWLADPVSPAGLSYSGLYGTSSNQQLLLDSGQQNLKADDFVFFRPRQSEAVLQQFGDIAVVENGKIVEMWPAFQATA